MRAAPAGECTCAGFREDLCPHCQEMNLWAHEVLYGAEDEGDDEVGRDDDDGYDRDPEDWVSWLGQAPLWLT